MPLEHPTRRRRILALSAAVAWLSHSAWSAELPRLQTDDPTLDRAFVIALADVEGNIKTYRAGVLDAPARVLMAGAGYTTPWTRDALSVRLRVEDAGCRRNPCFVQTAEFPARTLLNDVTFSPDFGEWDIAWPDGLLTCTVTDSHGHVASQSRVLHHFDAPECRR
jgi:hypothetical protein